MEIVFSVILNILTRYTGLKITLLDIKNVYVGSSNWLLECENFF